MAEPDYEDDLVFEPKSEKVKDFSIKKVLTTYDYQELQELREKVEDLKKDLKNALWYKDAQNDKSEFEKENDMLMKRCGDLERQGAGTRIDLESERIVNEHLCRLLKECKVLFEAERKFLVKCSRMEDIDNILTRINAALGESEEL